MIECFHEWERPNFQVLDEVEAAGCCRYGHGGLSNVFLETTNTADHLKRSK